MFWRRKKPGYLDKLLSISSNPIGGPFDEADFLDFKLHGRLGRELQCILQKKNGFYAFESALHFFPTNSSGLELTIAAWNHPDLWRFEYGDLAKGMLFFAEDAFALQFCLHKGRICSFNSETGEPKAMSRSFEDWAKQILQDYRFLTGHPLLHDWQKLHGPIRARKRLAPEIPFVLGGEFNLECLYEADVVELMRFRGHLAQQIKDLPDGGKVKLVIVDDTNSNGGSKPQISGEKSDYFNG